MGNSSGGAKKAKLDKEDEKLIAESKKNRELIIMRKPLGAFPNIQKDLAPSNLVRLTLNECQIDAMPPSINLLTSLQRLDLPGNAIPSIPVEFAVVNNVQWLDLSNNPLNEYPSYGFHMSLTYLDLSWCGLQTVDTGLGQLKNLNTLYLTGNKLLTLPPSAEKLSSLTRLRLNANRLSTIPQCLEKCLALKVLNVSGNKSMDDLPFFITRLPLEAIGIEGCDLNQIPPSVPRTAAVVPLDTPDKDRMAKQALLLRQHFGVVSQFLVARERNKGAPTPAPAPTASAAPAPAATGAAPPAQPKGPPDPPGSGTSATNGGTDRGTAPPPPPRGVPAAGTPSPAPAPAGAAFPVATAPSPTPTSTTGPPKPAGSGPPPPSGSLQPPASKPTVNVAAPTPQAGAGVGGKPAFEEDESYEYDDEEPTAVPTRPAPAPAPAAAKLAPTPKGAPSGPGTPASPAQPPPKPVPKGTNDTDISRGSPSPSPSPVPKQPPRGNDTNTTGLDSSPGTSPLGRLRPLGGGLPPRSRFDNDSWAEGGDKDDDDDIRPSAASPAPAPANVGGSPAKGEPGGSSFFPHPPVSPVKRTGIFPPRRQLELPTLPSALQSDPDGSAGPTRRDRQPLARPPLRPFNVPGTLEAVAFKYIAPEDYDPPDARKPRFGDDSMGSPGGDASWRSARRSQSASPQRRRDTSPLDDDDAPRWGAASMRPRPSAIDDQPLSSKMPASSTTRFQPSWAPPSSLSAMPPATTRNSTFAPPPPALSGERWASASAGSASRLDTGGIGASTTPFFPAAPAPNTMATSTGLRWAPSYQPTIGAGGGIGDHGGGLPSFRSSYSGASAGGVSRTGSLSAGVAPLSRPSVPRYTGTSGLDLPLFPTSGRFGSAAR